MSIRLKKPLREYFAALLWPSRKLNFWPSGNSDPLTVSSATLKVSRISSSRSSMLTPDCSFCINSSFFLASWSSSDGIGAVEAAGAVSFLPAFLSLTLCITVSIDGFSCWAFGSACGLGFAAGDTKAFSASLSCQAFSSASA